MVDPDLRAIKPVLVAKATPVVTLLVLVCFLTSDHDDVLVVRVNLTEADRADEVFHLSPIPVRVTKAITIAEVHRPIEKHFSLHASGDPNEAHYPTYDNHTDYQFLHNQPPVRREDNRGTY